MIINNIQRTVPKSKSSLRKGWTTGACATAAVKAAYSAILTGQFNQSVSITLPRGEKPSFNLYETGFVNNGATATIIKDAGDDPDVTHGALIRATVRKGKSSQGISFHAGEGVGTVTLPGLSLSVGEPAINLAPRRMMEAVVKELALIHQTDSDLEITISIKDGQKLAERTLNSRLGILGGLSILGTTGIVTPYSCAAWISSIHQSVDVACAAGISHIAGATGKTSENAVRNLHKLEDQALIEMGDFAGALIKYSRKQNLRKFTIAGGFAKISKLAQGHLDLHSGRSTVDIDFLIRILQELGASDKVLEEAQKSPSANALLSLAGNLPISEKVAFRALNIVREILQSPDVHLDIAIFNRAGELLGHAK